MCKVMIVVHLLLSKPPSLNYGCLEDTCRPVPPNTALFSLSLQVLGANLDLAQGQAWLLLLLLLSQGYFAMSACNTQSCGRLDAPHDN